jgi:membrane-bound lytic murein transglycosylase D
MHQRHHRQRTLRVISFAICLLCTACDTTTIVNQAESKPEIIATEANIATDAANDLRELNPGDTNTTPNDTDTIAIIVNNDKELTPETEIVGDLWERIRTGFTLPDGLDSHPEAQQRIQVYRDRLSRSPTLINQVSENATPYLYFVVNELRKHNMPLEIALLPIVESRYDPFAYSPGRASGLWQFIPGTGTRFGLNQDWWLDERRDTIAATGAAIQYLIYLNKMFDGDWLLAMASYNAGQGNVLRAIKKNKRLGKPTDYWSLDLPKETQHYIPKILAWRDIVRNPANYNVSLNPIADEPYFTIVDVGSQIDLAEVASLAEVDIDTIYELNPAYNRWASDPSPPHDLLIPFDNAETLQQKLNDLPFDQRMTWRRYIIQKNDSLIKIAKTFNTTPSLIASVNGIKNNSIRAGKALLIPSATKESHYYSMSAEQRLARRQQQAPKKHTQRIEHRVAAGESLWDIARKYAVNVNALARWNHMAPGDTLAVNKTLVIWSKKAPSPNAVANNETRKLYYTVKQGESLAYIANRFKVSVSDIQDWNNINGNKYIQPGQLLTLYVALTDRQLIAN